MIFKVRPLLTSREGSLVSVKPDRTMPEMPEVEGVATVAGAVTPSPVLVCPSCGSIDKAFRRLLPLPASDAFCSDGWHKDPLAPSSPNRCERLGAIREYTPSTGSPVSYKWRRRGLIAALVVDVALWWLIVSVGIAVYRWLK
jgi:hypothetical protein